MLVKHLQVASCYTCTIFVVKWRETEEDHVKEENLKIYTILGYIVSHVYQVRKDL